MKTLGKGLSNDSDVFPSPWIDVLFMEIVDSSGIKPIDLGHYYSQFYLFDIDFSNTYLTLEENQ